MSGRVLVLSFVISVVLLCCHCEDIFDTIEPIVRISPARDSSESQNSFDRFGFKAIAHQFQEVELGDSLETALQKTTIIVGAPNGKFPGGIEGLDYGYFACSETINASLLMSTTQEERAACLANFTTGLVYRCDLSTGDCGALVGNGDAQSPDGNLFERSGNDPDIVTASTPTNDGLERKQDQLMGYTLYSSDGFFIACAPLWKHISTPPNEHGAQPRGRCVYSDRSLSNFARLLPCQRGTDLNQNIGGYCTAGMGASIKKGDGVVEIAIGTPGRFGSRGGFAYYGNASDMNFTDPFKPATIYPSVGASDVLPNRNYENTPIAFGNVGYYGFSIIPGRFRDNSTDFLVSAPRYTKTDFLGYVYLLPKNGSYENVPDMFMTGKQFAEMFGYSMTALDLNNDGYDDAVISAPLYYERDLPELGRIFVFENNKGNGFLNATIINGHNATARFGSAITSLGDLNNDGYQDFAVSAPFEGSGIVYVYYGQEADSTGSIVNKQYAQRIDGGSFVNGVTNITEVSKFGFSLSGNVDVDNNRYNDLVIGAFGSQSVFVLRSRPFAYVDASLTSVNEVDLTSFNCPLDNAYYSCFIVTMCASFTGISVNDQFSTTFTVRETSTPTRLQFSPDPTSTSITLPITFNGASNPICVNVTAYVRNGTTSLDLFGLSANVLNIERDPIEVNTNTVPSDLSTIPVIVSTTAIAEVTVSAECGSDDVCDSALVLKFNSTVFRTVSGTLTDDQDNLVIDDAQRVDIVAEFLNANEDAFNTFITFSVPRQYFMFNQFSIQNIRVTCDDISPSNTTHDNRRCNIRTPFSKSDGTFTLTIRMSVKALTGTEGSIDVPIAIMIGPNSTRNNEDNVADNDININIPVSARSNFSVSGLFGTDTITYQGNHTPSDVNEASSLGESLSITSTFRNNGPSIVQNATLTLYVPTKSSITGNYYFYYPASLSTSSDNIACSSDGINPGGYNVNSGRKRRSVRNRRGLNRFGRQTIVEEPEVDCALTPDMCLKISCNVTNLGRSGVDVMIGGYLDERFYFRKEASYLLQAYAVGEVTNSFFNTTGSTTSVNFTVTISIQALASRNSSIPWYIIAAPTIAAFIFLAVLALLLYCFGFFKRRSVVKELATNEEFDQFAPNPFGPTGGSGRVPTNKADDPELLKYEQKGKEE